MPANPNTGMALILGGVLLFALIVTLIEMYWGSK